jgi:hypothetical protein
MAGPARFTSIIAPFLSNRAAYPQSEAKGGRPAWPGGEVIPEFIVGHTTHDIDVTQTIWDFSCIIRYLRDNSTILFFMMW